jgi:formate hydrogenlyase subunit 4
MRHLMRYLLLAVLFLSYFAIVVPRLGSGFAGIVEIVVSAIVVTLVGTLIESVFPRKLHN